MSNCSTQIEKIKDGKFSVNGKIVYASEFSSREVAIRWAYEGSKEWAVSHPSIAAFLVVRPVDAARIEKAGGKILR